MLNELARKQLKEELLTYLEKLIEGLPQYGEICLRVKICDFKIGTIFTGIEIAQKATKVKEG